MSHPKNRRERFEVGNKNGKKRVGNMFPSDMYDDEEKRSDLIDRYSKVLRNTGKPCSCFQCGNPRKHFSEKTMQEKKFEERTDRE